MIFKTYPLSITVSFLLVSIISSAQEWQAQIVAGAMNYGGDLQSKGYTFKQSHGTAGINILFRINHIALRAGGAVGHISGADGITTNTTGRNLNFNSNIAEGNGVLEYHILSDDKDYKIIPYVFIGAGVYHFNPYTYYDSQRVYLQPLGTEGQGLSNPGKKFYQLTDLAALYGVGFRYKLSPDFLIGVEYNARLLRTDYLDDVSSKYPDETKLYDARGQVAVNLSYRGSDFSTFPTGRTRGNPKSNDNYYSTVVSLTYVFPKHSSSFGNGSTGNRKRFLKSLLCPKKVR